LDQHIEYLKDTRDIVKTYCIT